MRLSPVLLYIAAGWGVEDLEPSETLRKLIKTRPKCTHVVFVQFNSISLLLFAVQVPHVNERVLYRLPRQGTIPSSILSTCGGVNNMKVPQQASFSHPTK